MQITLHSLLMRGHKLQFFQNRKLLYALINEFKMAIPASSPPPLRGWGFDFMFFQMLINPHPSGALKTGKNPTQGGSLGLFHVD